MELDGQIKRLYEASLVGDVSSLLNLLQEDEMILDRCAIQKSDCFTQSPLFIASSFGHLAFVAEILLRNPKLAEEVDCKQWWSPLHVSATNGHVEVVKALLAVNVNVCLLGDRDGRNPVHVAVMNGHVGAVSELLRAKPQVARERTRGGETDLHLCVKYGQRDALRLFVGVMDDVELLNLKDNNGNTILHLAVMTRQY